MLQQLSLVPVYVDSHGRVIGKAMLTQGWDVPIRYTPPPTPNGAPALWNALQCSIPLSPMSSTRPSPVITPCTWRSTGWTKSHLGLHEAFPISLPSLPTLTATGFSGGHNPPPTNGERYYNNVSAWDDPSSWVRPKYNKGDSNASSQFKATHKFLSKDVVLGRVRDVGTRHTAVQLVTWILALRKQELYFGPGWKQTAIDLRMVATEVICSTFSSHCPIAPSLHDLVTGDDSWVRAATRAIEVATLFVELIKLGIMTPGDLACAMGILVKGQNRTGYLTLLKTLLEAGQYFAFNYSDFVYLKEDIKERLPAAAVDIRRIIDSIPCPIRD